MRKMTWFAVVNVEDGAFFELHLLEKNAEQTARDYSIDGEEYEVQPTKITLHDLD